MPSDHHQAMRSLFQAAAKNDVNALNGLIRENPRLFSDISSHNDRTTPLHVSASRGHLDFTESLLSQDPWLATARDSHGRTPLHVASAEGHEKVVKALLGPDPCDRCLTKDKGGRIPLHWAVMRGKVAVVKELFAACPESLNVTVTLEEDTALHLAVKYKQLHTLQALTSLVDENDYYSGILTEGNREGNTILHLAVLLDQTKMVEHLLKIPKVKKEAPETLNNEGFNALEALENKSTPEYLERRQLREALKEKGVRPRKEPSDKTWIKLIFKFIYDCFTVNWMTEARAQLIVVSTIITTITFQVAVNPPGGVFQVSYTDMKNNDTVNMLKATHRCQKNYTHYYKDCQLPGNAVFGYFNPIEFSILTVFNTGAFLGSICITIVLASGLPLLNPLVLSFFNLGVAFTLESLIVTFLLSLDLSIPLLRRTVLGFFELWETLLALGVFGIFLTLNELVFTWELYTRILNYIKKALALTKLLPRNQNGTSPGRP